MWGTVLLQTSLKQQAWSDRLLKRGHSWRGTLLEGRIEDPYLPDGTPGEVGLTFNVAQLAEAVGRYVEARDQFTADLG